jgi:hypothetical protein
LDDEWIFRSRVWHWIVSVVDEEHPARGSQA